MPGQMGTPIAQQSTQTSDQKEAERMTRSLASLMVPPKSYYTAIIKKPTGKNGLEEYLKCVDAVRASDAGKYTTAISDVQYNERAASINKMPVPEWAVGKSPAELRHEQTKRFEKLLDLITKGNQKPVEDPLLPTMTSPEHAALEFPMYGGFKSITKLAVNVADAHISDGDTKDATSRLIDQLRFSHKVRELGILADLVGIAMDAIVCREIENHLVDFKGEDWDRFTAFARLDLKSAPPLKRGLELEAPGHLKYISESEGLADEASPKSADESEQMKGIDQLARDLHGLSEKDRKRTIKEAVGYAQARFNSAEVSLTRPEAEWPWPENKGAPPPSPLIGELTSDVIPNPDEFQAEAKSRIVMRLLIVHGLIQKYRISHGHLPSTLKDLNSPADIEDPLLGGNFKYEPTGATYRLYSPGKGVMYPIELTMKPELYPKIRSQLEHKS